MARKFDQGFLLALAIATLVQSSTAQTAHVVGGAMNWIVPPGGATAYSTWAANQTFNVGDILGFNFATGRHDVAEVTKAAFDGCNTANPISRVTTSPANITLNSAGEHYYICTFTGHCGAGQKLAVNVSTSGAASPAPQPSSPAPQPSSSSPVPTPSSSPGSNTVPPGSSPNGGIAPPTPTTPSSPSPTGAVTPTSSPGNSAKSLRVALSSTFLAIFVGFLY